MIYGTRDDADEEAGSTALGEALAFGAWGEYSHGGGDYLGWGAGAGEEEVDEERATESDHSIALSGSDLSLMAQQSCASSRLGWSEPPVDWDALWMSWSDAASFSMPLAHLRWRSTGRVDPEHGHSVFATICGAGVSETIVFTRIVELRRRGAAVWDFWAYRTPDCHSEGLPAAWLERHC